MTESSQSRAWSLPGALGIQPGDVVALVGGGGKTSTMFRLAETLAAEGQRVIVTTTTHIGRDESVLASRHLVCDPRQYAAAQVTAALQVGSPLLVTTRPTEHGLRWGGIPAEWIDDWTADAILVEADGARGLPFKAPAAHEPVVPRCTTLLVPVVGVDAVGRPMGAVAHRPARVTAITGLSVSALLAPGAIAQVLSHPDGGMKGCPASARVCVLVNRVESQAELSAAREIARHLLKPAAAGRPAQSTAGLHRVIIGAVTTARPVQEVHRRVAAVVLAAGRSVRMRGEVPKLLLPWRGKTVIRQVVETLSSLPLHPLVVVTGHAADLVTQSLQGTGARIIHNPDYAAGEMLSSLKTAIRWLGGETGGCLVVLGDQPWLEAPVVSAVLDGYARGPGGIVAPAFEGRRGHPVIIDRRHWPEILALEPNLEPRDLLRRHPADLSLVPQDDGSIVRDMDTWDDYQRALAIDAGRRVSAS